MTLIGEVSMSFFRLLIISLLFVSCSKNKSNTFGKLPKKVQPDILMWDQVKFGDTLDIVRAKLGNEISKSIVPDEIKAEDPDVICVDFYVFGEIKYDNQLVHNAIFSVDFVDGVVDGKNSPFDLLEPSISNIKIIITAPLNNARLNFHPVDARWKHIYSKRDVVYEIQLEIENGGEWITEISKSNIPYFPLKTGGMNRYRFKVRAFDGHEYSKWSDYVNYQHEELYKK